MHYHWKKADQFILLVNNLGTTTNLEMGIFINDLLQLLEIEGVTITFIKIRNIYDQSRYGRYIRNSLPRKK